MAFSFFYDCVALDEAVPSDHPLPVTLRKVKAMLTEVLIDEGDFIGIIDDQGTTLQLLKQHGGIWMEVPDPENEGSYGKHVTLDEARQTLDELGDTIEHYLIDGLLFEKWQ